ncbi:MAG: hypothetical protein R3B57_03535 [Phycisphaerales bacterium]
MALKAGTFSNYASSMAQAMEDAMQSVYQERHGTPMPSAGVEDRRMLFVAIAQGVIRHLADNPGAFHTKVNCEQSSENITSSNGSISVTQDETRVKSEGDGTGSSIDTSDLY